MTKEFKLPNQKAIPEEYARFNKLFSDKLETGLPEHSRWDYKINFLPGKEPKFSKVYLLNEKQLEALKKYLAENLKKGYIRPL